MLRDQPQELFGVESGHYHHWITQQYRKRPPAEGAGMIEWTGYQVDIIMSRFKQTGQPEQILETIAAAAKDPLGSSGGARCVCQCGRDYSGWILFLRRRRRALRNQSFQIKTSGQRFTAGTDQNRRGVDQL